MKLALAAIAATIIGGLVLAFPALADHDTHQRLEAMASPAGVGPAVTHPQEPRRVISRVVGSAFLLNRDGTVFTGE